MLTIRLGHTCEVLRDGVQIGPWPCESALILLWGLAHEGTRWSARSEVAAKLFPAGDQAKRMNALRQCILRLRNWIGDDELEVHPRFIRLSPGKWSLEIEEGEAADLCEIIPWIEHPWIDEIRRRRRTAAARSAVSPMAGLIHSIEQVAKDDVDAARGLFVSAYDLADSFSVQEFYDLASILRPLQTASPFAAEFRIACAWMSYRNGHIEESVRQAKLAEQSTQRPEVLAHAASLRYYAGIERNDDKEIAAARRRLLETNLAYNIDHIDMCLFWNKGLFAEAIEARNKAITRLHESPRNHQLNFWLNSGYFASDYGDRGACREACEEAAKLIVPSLDGGHLITYHNVQAKMHLLEHNADAAQRSLGEARDIFRRFGRKISALYIQETQSEVTAALGQYERARAEWGGFFQRRRSIGMSITARLQRQQSRVLV